MEPLFMKKKKEDQEPFSEVTKGIGKIEKFFGQKKRKKVVECVACGKPVSRLAKTCHHCNEPEPGEEDKSKEVTDGPFFERLVKFILKFIGWLFILAILSPIFTCWQYGYFD